MLSRKRQFSLAVEELCRLYSDISIQDMTDVLTRKVKSLCQEPECSALLHDTVSPYIHPENDPE